MKLARVASITAVLLEEGLGFLTHAEAPDSDDLPVPESEAAQRLRQTLERLGPTFVKFGQLLATRVDLFGEAFIDELAKLHSEVEPFDSDEARSIIEAELERPIDEVFAELSSTPVAAASIAQVYKGRLRHEDRWVAVKVQRPGLEDSLLSDLDTLLVLSGFIDRLVPRYRRSMVHRVAEEYALRARTEIDFLAEARAIDRFADVLTTLPEFRIPKLEPSLCTPRVLVMEWIDGPKLSDLHTPADLRARGVDPEAFCRSMLRLQLSMAYEHGFVHGDTHPGNLILDETGHIALIDFGLHGQVPRPLREKMLEMVFCQASGKIDEAVDAFAQVFQPDPTADVAAFKQELKGVLAVGSQEGALRDKRITEQLVRGMRVGAKYRLRTQSDLFMVIRNLTIVEGIVLRYCPTMDPAAEVKAITGGILRRKLFGPNMQEELTQLLPQLMLTLSQRPRLAERLLKLERAFTESRDLGEFLRREGVLEPATPAASPTGTLVVVGLFALALGIALGLLL
ncbi:MAG: AarF/UbiB family protein [Myxococcota bacterium]